MKSLKILWWGRSDPNYSRNRILLQEMASLGWEVNFFSPLLSRTGDLEARLKRFARPDLVWVPCFRQRDLDAAIRYSRSNRIPIVADPLISAYDKQVFERHKMLPEDSKAKKLLKWESRLFDGVDCLIADTQAHADFFNAELGVSAERLIVVPVSAEEGHFYPREKKGKDKSTPLEVLFFGSFIPLQGPQVIIRAASLYDGQPIRWCMVGHGALHEECRTLAKGLESVEFAPWVPYEELPLRIAQADLLLGVFGTTPKAARVIPNKVYQAAACGRPLITMHSDAYPGELLSRPDSGFDWVNPGDAEELAHRVRQLAEHADALPSMGAAARCSYDEFFSSEHVRGQLMRLIDLLGVAN